MNAAEALALSKKQEPIVAEAQRQFEQRQAEAARLKAEEEQKKKDDHHARRYKDAQDAISRECKNAKTFAKLRTESQDNQDRLVAALRNDKFQVEIRNDGYENDELNGDSYPTGKTYWVNFTVYYITWEST